jgi:hypothetical protein
MDRLAFSAEIWKRDLRTKQGTRKVETIDYMDLTKEEVQAKMGKLFRRQRVTRSRSLTPS